MENNIKLSYRFLFLYLCGAKQKRDFKFTATIICPPRHKPTLLAGKSATVGSGEINIQLHVVTLSANYNIVQNMLGRQGNKLK